MYLRTIKVRSSNGMVNEYVRVVEAYPRLRSSWPILPPELGLSPKNPGNSWWKPQKTACSEDLVTSPHLEFNTRSWSRGARRRRCSCGDTPGPKTGRRTPTTLWSRACAPSRGPDSTSSPTSANSTTTRNDAGNAPSSFTTDRAKTGNSASSPMPSPYPCPMIPRSYRSAWARWAGPIPAASAMSGWACGSGSSSTSTRSSTATSPRARKRSGPPTSWRSRSSTASAPPAANSHWRSTGIAPRAWRICSACPRQRRDQGPLVPDTGPPTEGPGGDRERPEGPTREPVPTRLRPAALRPDQHLLRGTGRGERPGPSRLFPRSPQRLQTDRAGLDRDPRRFPPGPPDAGGQHARSPDRRDHRRDDRGAVREITAGLGHGPGHDQRGVTPVLEPVRSALSAGHAAR